MCSFSPHFSLPRFFFFFVFPDHPTGFVNENLGLKQIQYSQEGSSGRAGERERERERDAPEASLCFAVFKLMKELPNYFASVDFHEKAPVISHNTLFISLA